MGSVLGDKWRFSSRKRLLLSVYLDFIIFGVLWAYAQRPIFDLLPELERAGFLMKLAAFTLAEVILYQVVKWNPGNYLLSITYLDVRAVSGAGFVLPGRKVPVVDARIKDNESWLTILIAVLFMNEGLKSMVRWSMWSPPVPLFGYQTDALTSSIFMIAVGALECFIAYLIFRLRRPAFTLGLCYLGVNLASTVMSWNLWDPWVEEMTIRRREYFGMAVRPGEVEMMQKFTPELLVVGLIFCILLLLLIRKRIIFGGD